MNFGGLIKGDAFDYCFELLMCYLIKPHDERLEVKSYPFAKVLVVEESEMILTNFFKACLTWVNFAKSIVISEQFLTAEFYMMSFARHSRKNKTTGGTTLRTMSC